MVSLMGYILLAGVIKRDNINGSNMYSFGIIMPLMYACAFMYAMCVLSLKKQMNMFSLEGLNFRKE